MKVMPFVLLAMALLSVVIASYHLWMVRRQRRMLEQWKALNDILLHLCVGAYLLRMWPLRLRDVMEIERDSEPEPQPRKRFWQRGAPRR